MSAGEAERRLVADHPEARVADRRDDLARAIPRPVVDEDQLEVLHGLRENALDGFPDGCLRVAGGEDDGHERRRHGALRVACAGAGSGCRPPHRPRRRARSIEPPSWRRSSTRCGGRAIVRSGSWSSIRTPTTASRGCSRRGRRSRRSTSAAQRRLSRARNAALPGADGGPGGVSRRRLPLPARPPRAGRRAVRRRGLDGLSGRPVAADGAAVGRWPSTPRGRHAGHRLAHRQLAHDLSPPRDGRARGRFRRGPRPRGGTRWSSGEEIDYLVQALRAGARIEYDPSLVITHR